MYQCAVTLTTVSTPWVPDEVWLQLRPSAARLTTRQRLKAAVWIVIASLLAFALVYVFASGAVVHRLSIETLSESGTYDSCVETVTIANNGWFDETVLSATLNANGTGAVLRRSFARSIPSGGSRSVFLRYRGAYCRKSFGQNSIDEVPSVASPALVLELKRPWGSTTETVALDQGFNAGTSFFINW